jgi:hypothetical protein
MKRNSMHFGSTNRPLEATAETQKENSDFSIGSSPPEMERTIKSFTQFQVSNVRKHSQKKKKRKINQKPFYFFSASVSFGSRSGGGGVGGKEGGRGEREKKGGRKGEREGEKKKSKRNRL